MFVSYVFRHLYFFYLEWLSFIFGICSGTFNIMECLGILGVMGVGLGDGYKHSLLLGSWFILG